MSRRTLFVRLAGALVGIAAVAFAAASIERPVEYGGSGGSGGEDTGSGPAATPPQELPQPYEIDPPAFLEYLAALVAVFLAIAMVWYLIENHREAVKYLASLAVLAVAFLAIRYVAELLGLQGTPIESPEQPPPPESEGGSPGTGAGTTNSFPMGPTVAVLVALAVIFLGALVMTRDGDDEDDTLDVEGAADRSSDAAAIGAAAGRAAERIEGADADAIDNEVYRAWRDMTALLEVSHPETSTPGEFAAAAVSAGIEREDVEELTDLFEAVRYGDVETTEEMESRAVSVLRRIEDEYASLPGGEVANADGPAGGEWR